jgi:non-specific serine/threonine protein kinase
MSTYSDHNGESRNKQLIAIIHPDGLFELDWQATNQKLDSNTLAMQNEIDKYYRQQYEQFWFWLGLVKSSEAMSESLSYLIRIAASFVRKLAQNPDIEALREKIRIEFENGEIEELLHRAVLQSRIRSTFR